MRQPYATDPRAPWTERVCAGAMWALVGYIAFIGLNVALRARGVVPGYDALSYVDSAMRVYLGLTGALDPAGGFAWESRPFTNTFDVLTVGLLWGVVDHHLSTWALHTAYLALFAFFLRRLLDGATALVIVAITVMSTYFLHQYTNLISEMKVGMFLALFVAYLFHPDGPRHRRSLFFITLVLLLLRTIDLLFIGPLAVVFAALRGRAGESRRNILRELAPLGLAILVMTPLLAMLVPELLDYIHSTGAEGTRQNWMDMAGVHGKAELLAAYVAGLLAYNRDVQLVATGVAVASVALLATRWRGRLLGLAGPFLSSVAVFAILMTAASMNMQVVSWLYALEALLLGLWLRALAPRLVVALAGLVLFALAVPYEFRSFLELNRQQAANAPIVALSRELAANLREYPRAHLYANYWGVGPLDHLGMEVALERRILWPKVSPVSYDITVPQYLKALDESDVVFMANRNFGWYTFLNVNRHTGEIAQAFAADAPARGWMRGTRALYDADPDRYVDVYVRPFVEPHLKYGDSWMDAGTPMVLRAPPGQALPAGFRLQLALMVPGVEDPAFKPPWQVALRDAEGREVASARIERAGDTVLQLPLGGAAAGIYTLAFDKTFTPPGDPRRLSAILKSAQLRFVPPAR